MNDCPPIEILLQEDDIHGRLAEHVARCEACSTIVTLKAFRGLPDRPETRGGCDAAVNAIAALADGILDDIGHRRLAVHLASCAPCRETALRVSLFKDDFALLPEIVIPPVPEKKRRQSRAFGWPHLAAAAMAGAVATAGALRLEAAAAALRDPGSLAMHLDAACAGERAELDAERARLEALRKEIAAREAKLAAERARQKRP